MWASDRRTGSTRSLQQYESGNDGKLRQRVQAGTVEQSGCAAAFVGYQQARSGHKQQESSGGKAGERVPRGECQRLYHGQRQAEDHAGHQGAKGSDAGNARAEHDRNGARADAAVLGHVIPVGGSVLACKTVARCSTKRRRSGLMTWSLPILPSGSHHRRATQSNLLISWSSTFKEGFMAGLQAGVEGGYGAFKFALRKIVDECDGVKKCETVATQAGWTCKRSSCFLSCARSSSSSSKGLSCLR